MPTVTHTLEGPDLEALLAQVPSELGPDATIVAANKVRSGGLGGFFTKEAFEVVVEVPERAPAPIAAEDRLPAPSAHRVSTEAIGFAGVLDRMVRDAGIDDSAPRPVGPAFHRPTPPTVAVSAPEGAAEEEHFEPLLPVRVERRDAPAARAVPAPPALDQRWLARVGIPTNVAAHLTTVSDDPTIELFHLMESLIRPEPLPTSRGAIIAVVGRRSDALGVAEAFAAKLGTSPDDILVAAPSFRGASVVQERRLSSVDLAMEQRRSWRRRTQPTIIAVDASLGRVRSTWASHLLDAIEPTMVWGVVEASRKAEDIRDWAARFGGLDALAVTDLEDTVSPATVLGAGVPVGLLDGHEATASRWTAILAEHLEVAA